MRTKLAHLSPLFLLAATGEVTRTLHAEPVTIPAPKIEPTRADVVFVADRSGSMWGQMDTLKSTLHQVLGIYDALGTQSDLSVSLISYSSDGDVTEHFRHIPMAQAPQNPTVLRGVNQLAPTGMTGMSQGVRMAQGFRRDGRVLFVVLLSDGYCNDPSPRTEQESVRDLAEQIHKAGGLVSTVSFGDWSDFKFLTQVAQVGGSTCQQARSAADLYRSFEAAVKNAAGLQTKAIRVPIENGALLVLVDPATRTVRASLDDLVLPSLPSVDSVILRLTETATPETFTGFNPLLGCLTARAYLSLGEIELAKQAAIGSGSTEARQHWRAITSEDQKVFAATLDDLIFGSDPISLDQTPSVIPEGPSITDFFQIVRDFAPGTFEVKTSTLKGYQRRTVAPLQGTRQEGVFTPFPYRLESVEAEYGPVTDVVGSRNNANLSIQVTLPATLQGPGGEVREVAGVTLDRLRSVRNYSIVADGKVYFSQVTFRVTDRRAREALAQMGFTVGEGGVLTVPFGTMAVSKKDPGSALPTKSDMTRLQRVATLQKFFSAVIPKGESERFDATQVAALKAVGLTPSLNFSAPTVTPYEDLKIALSKGEIDTRVTYRVMVGTPEAPDLFGVLKSGNDFLDRRFTATLAGVAVSKEDLECPVFLKGAVFSEKALSARSKPGLADEIQFPLFQGVLGIRDTPEYLDTMKTIFGTQADEVRADLARIRSGAVPVAEAIATMKKLTAQAAAYIDLVWEGTINPLVLYTGAMGQIPASLNPQKVSATDIPGPLSKAMKDEGVFFRAGELLITVLGEQEYVQIQAKAA